MLEKSLCVSDTIFVHKDIQNNDIHKDMAKGLYRKHDLFCDGGWKTDFKGIWYLTTNVGIYHLIVTSRIRELLEVNDLGQKLVVTVC